MRFSIDLETEELSSSARIALEGALSDVVEGDVPLAVELLFVDEEEIRRLNRETRDTDKVTDVLSYPTLEDICGKPLYADEHPYDIDEEGRLVVGSIVVCCKRAREQAEEYGHTFERELHYLVVHGVMHCLGYDHIEEGDKALMREREEYVLKKLGITR